MNKHTIDRSDARPPAFEIRSKPPTLMEAIRAPLKQRSASDGAVAPASATVVITPDGSPMGPVIIPNDTLAAERTDGGKKPARPARKKKATLKPKRREALHEHAHLKPETGQIADFNVDLSSWKEVEL